MKVAFVSGAYNSPHIFKTLVNIWKARRVAKRLWNEGWAVICPHTNSGLFGDKSLRYYFLHGYISILDRLDPKCDIVYMLKGWQKSQGARAEWTRARMKGMKIIYQR